MSSRRTLTARVVEGAGVRGLVAPCAGGWHLWRSHPGYRRACRMLRRARARWVAQDLRNVARVCLLAIGEAAGLHDVSHLSGLGLVIDKLEAEP